MDTLKESVAIDWTNCPLVEVIPGKVSGVPLLKGTRLPADTILENYEGGSPVDEIADNFDMPEQIITAVLSYAANHRSNKGLSRTSGSTRCTLGSTKPV